MRVLGMAGMTPPDAAIRPGLNLSTWLQLPNLKNHTLHATPERR